MLGSWLMLLAFLRLMVTSRCVKTFCFLGAQRLNAIPIRLATLWSLTKYFHVGRWQENGSLKNRKATKVAALSPASHERKIKLGEKGWGLDLICITKRRCEGRKIRNSAFQICSQPTERSAHASPNPVSSWTRAAAGGVLSSRKCCERISIQDLESARRTLRSLIYRHLRRSSCSLHHLCFFLRIPGRSARQAPQSRCLISPNMDSLLLPGGAGPALEVPTLGPRPGTPRPPEEPPSVLLEEGSPLCDSDGSADNEESSEDEDEVQALSDSPSTGALTPQVEQQDAEEAGCGMEELPFPDYKAVVFRCLHQTDYPRFWCLRLISWRYPLEFALGPRDKFREGEEKAGGKNQSPEQLK